MKRFYMGVGLLLVLLTGSALLSGAAVEIHDPISFRLEQAAEAALAGDWPRAKVLTEAALRRWQRNRIVTAMFADHEPMEQIDSGFSQIAVFLRQEDGDNFPAACAALARLARAMADSQRLSWQNLL